MRSGGSGWASPERRMVWTEPKAKQKKVAVVYYLCRQDGHLDHPHLVQVSLSEPQRGLHLRDFIARLSALRGAAMPAAYSWSAKRSYRNNGYVWHDLTPDDLIHGDANANEYVLKGSPLLCPFSSSSTQLPPPTARKNNRTTAQLAPALAELAIDEISPPPSSSSPDNLETLINNDVASASAAPILMQAQGNDEIIAPGVIASGRMRASAMLMHLISCGGSIKEHGRHGKEMDMDRDYLSGTLVETSTKSKRATDADLTLRRSSSCNAHRGAGSSRSYEAAGLTYGKWTAGGISNS